MGVGGGCFFDLFVGAACGVLVRCGGGVTCEKVRTVVYSCGRNSSARIALR